MRNILKNNEVDTYNKILLATFKLVATFGYAKVSIRDIAKEANVAISQITYHYKNKDNLMIEVIRFVKQEYLSTIEYNLKKYNTTKERINFLISYCKEMINSDTKIYKVLLDLFSMSMWSKVFSNEFQLFFEEVTDVLEKYLKFDSTVENKLKIYKSEEVTRLILGLIFGLSIQFISDKNNEDILSSLNIVSNILD